MEKQRLLEAKKHGTPRFPIECFTTAAAAQGERFLVQLHWHHNVEMMQMLGGTAEITIGNETFSAKAGDIYIINQEELHRIVSEDATLSYSTFIFPLQALAFATGDNAQAYLEPLMQNTMRFPVQILQNESKALLCDILKRILSAAEQKAAGYELMIKALLLQLIAELICHGELIAVQQSPSEKSRRLKQILEYIQNNYAAPLTITAMADTFHMSEKYFSRYFRTATGQNFTAYLNAVRIENARILLRETDRTVLEIALECGYENVSYFNRVFRSQMGFSPLKYRLSAT